MTKFQQPMRHFVGERVGMLTLLGYEGRRTWRVRCSCGAERSMSKISLDTPNMYGPKSCGCARVHTPPVIEKENLEGQRYGSVVVGKWHHKGIEPSGTHTHWWHTLCDCGKERIVRHHQIKKQRSCGCAEKITRYSDPVTGKNLRRQLRDVGVRDPTVFYRLVEKGLAVADVVNLASAVVVHQTITAVLKESPTFNQKRA